MGTAPEGGNEALFRALRHEVVKSGSRWQTPMPSDPTADAGRDAGHLAALIARAGANGKRPPVERWNPPFCGAIDIRIDREGRWHYLGSPIGREPLVRLFASVLKREGDAFMLVTPVEKVEISVDDVPFMAVEMHAEGVGADRRITFRTNVGDLVEAGADSALRFSLTAGGGLVAYVMVRAGLEARLTRALMHELADLIEEGPHGDLGLHAGGVFHLLPPGALDETPVA